MLRRIVLALVLVGCGEASAPKSGDAGTTGSAGSGGGAAGGSGGSMVGASGGGTTAGGGRGGAPGAAGQGGDVATGAAGAGGSPCPGTVLVQCAGFCVDLGINSMHCGGCNRPCMIGSCVGGVCRQATGAPLCSDLGWTFTQKSPCGPYDGTDFQHTHKGGNNCFQCYGATSPQPADCLAESGLYGCGSGTTAYTCGSLCVLSCGECQ